MDRFLLSERNTYLGNTGAERIDKLLKLLPIVTLVVTLVTFVAFVVAYKNRQERPAYVVQTHESQIEGRAVMVEGVQVVEFLGIPFAESTAGSSRFRRPVARSLPRRLSARRWGPPCIQRKHGSSSANFSSTTATYEETATTTSGRDQSTSDAQPTSLPSVVAAVVSETAEEDFRGTSRVTPPASGVLDAREQPSEDCLHLNIWVPHTESGNSSTTSDSGEVKQRGPKRPVIVFFHGGGFQEGSNSEPRYDGRYLSALGGVVVVVPNYRVGPLAFIGSDDGSDEDEPGNLALLDQRMALEWVRSYIDDFDGDPGCIVVAGAGSGATSLALHLLSPEAQGTLMDLRRFVLHSGSAFGPYADRSVPRQSTQNLVPMARSVGCTGSSAADIIRCLRTVSADALARLEPGPGGPFEPTFESQYLPDTPSGLLLKIPPFRKQARATAVYAAACDCAYLENRDVESLCVYSRDPFCGFSFYRTDFQVLMGNVADEGHQAFSAFNETLPVGLSPESALHEFLPQELAKYGVHDEAKALLRVYLNDSAGAATGLTWDETQNVVSHLLGDLLYVCPTIYLAHYLSRGSDNQVYTFRMNQRPSYGTAETMIRYEDVDLVFGLPLREQGATDAEKSLSRDFIRAWSNFAKFGVLPLVNDSSSGSTIEWPAHSESEEATVDISTAGFSLVPDEHRSHCFQLQTLAADDVV
ncbi:cholinesterase-like [Dermacentor andersoni]|uniref:cholinesterase-like n=1 Tax=Dermacentor andersoni TaxID=34620 RepID=UPI003B3ACBC1